MSKTDGRRSKKMAQGETDNEVNTDMQTYMHIDKQTCRQNTDKETHDMQT